VAYQLSNIDKLRNLYWETFAPSQKLTVEECASLYRVLTSDSSEKTGPWDTSVAPYTRFPMEVLSQQEVKEVVLMWASQCAKTEVLLNFLLWTVICAPGPTTICYSEKGAAEEDLVAARVEPMISQSPVMRKLFFSKGDDSAKGRKKRYSTTFKSYVGGYMKFVHPSPTSLAGRPTKYFIFDELSRGVKTFNKEGDVYAQAKVRTTNFSLSSKILAVSSPGDEGSCPTALLFDSSRQYILRLPCPSCEGMIELLWEQMRYELENPDGAYYECQLCKARIESQDRRWMLERHEWHCTTPERSMRMVGFQMSALNSPWLDFKDLVHEFLIAQKDPSAQKMKTFVNTRLGRLYRNEKIIADSARLFAKREKYGFDLPRNAIFLTCAADVNDFGIAYEVVGWGHGEESWSIEYNVIYGSPVKSETWEVLQSILEKRWKHELGINLYISRMAVDVNYLSTVALQFVQKNSGKCFGIKGDGRDGTPLVGKILRARTGLSERHYDIFEIGVNEAKELVYDRLTIEEPGPGYCHFPEKTGYTQQYFQELTSEYKAIETDSDGMTKIKWKKRDHLRNEPLDVRVYNTWCMKSYPINFEWIDEQLLARKARVEERVSNGEFLNTYEADIHLLDKSQSDGELQYKQPERSIEDYMTTQSSAYKSWRKRGGYDW
jgi:phage terminase large subunit GpA-like protein